MELKLISMSQLLMQQYLHRNFVIKAIRGIFFFFFFQAEPNKFYRVIGFVNPGPYPERISYRLTGMGAEKNVPQKQKVKLLTLACLFLKRKFNESPKDFSINYPYSNKCGKMIFSF